MQIIIYQGNAAPPKAADITIVIDVIRAFTVAHYAFLQGVHCIFLADSIEQALQIKKENPDFLLAGEVDGLAIEGFDLDNSPSHIKQLNLTGKTLVQKTTNGVRAALNCLASKHVFVTGFSNAKQTAAFIREKMAAVNGKMIHIIASHPSGDDDLACAEYIKSMLEGSSNLISAQEVKERIKHSHVAEKFFDEENPVFLREDINNCLKEINTDFVMKMNTTSEIPKIERVNV
ncbi:2-phosphosulfolactate phosphatase [Virgibacillus dakarensis]|uniref:Probable 2-phosphosulfolactate phosphatase n=1 Tax=Lentibacillus populi TaxID=1827502 RepID=A0A9W5X411_9BACI|nr:MULTISPECIES: 2-phosphosulfolactate phosphatase [Bacillaceae]MBT2214953.1 2-phosphosulfolactate phosphatase [Virgibacillus dakarensis]MTW84827.1 2-phosphosulfolactate phosphatase [Virgibacillus dakarensis]GGB31510.1 putative 2-phosphosulfolactate phosphatase [Lentibacillus populi]